MLVASMVFFAISVASLVMGVRAYSRIEAAREKDRAELRRTTNERRKRALAFVSYRGTDRDLAMACAHRLEAQGYEVVRYDPKQLWDDPMEKIIRSVTTANAFVYVAGASSDWIKAELELSKELGLPFFPVHSVGELDAANAAIRTASEQIDLVARLGCHHPHDREILALKLIGAHTDDLGKDTARGRYAQQWLSLGEIVGAPGHPGYFWDRLKYVGGAFGCYVTLAIGIVLLVIHLLR